MNTEHNAKTALRPVTGSVRTSAAKVPAEPLHRERPRLTDRFCIRAVLSGLLAREAVTRFGGRLPSDHDTLLSFKGIGRYTAGAVASFAYERRAPLVDTNVARVLHRGRADDPLGCVHPHG